MASFSMFDRLRSFRHAFRGAITLLKTQHNAWLHLLATLLAALAGYLVHVSRVDWALLVFAAALVWIAEAFNTAIEFLADEVTRERREGIKNAKDVAAFGVLASAATAVLIGGVVFVPSILAMI